MSEATTYTHPGLKVTHSADGVTVEAHHSALVDWATRPGSEWPCSQLRELGHLHADFDSNGLLDLDASEWETGLNSDVDLGADEFNAFTSDAIAAVLPTDHACYLVTVGQFQDGGLGS